MSKQRSCNSLRIEVRHGKHTLGIAFLIEKAVNYDSENLEWAPEADEMDLVSESHSLLSETPSLGTVGLHLSCDSHLRTRF